MKEFNAKKSPFVREETSASHQCNSIGQTLNEFLNKNEGLKIDEEPSAQPFPNSCSRDAENERVEEEIERMFEEATREHVSLESGVDVGESSPGVPSPDVSSLPSPDLIPDPTPEPELSRILDSPIEASQADDPFNWEYKLPAPPTFRDIVDREATSSPILTTYSTMTVGNIKDVLYQPSLVDDRPDLPKIIGATEWNVEVVQELAAVVGNGASVLSAPKEQTDTHPKPRIVSDKLDNFRITTYSSKNQSEEASEEKSSRKRFDTNSAQRAADWPSRDPKPVERRAHLSGGVKRSLSHVSHLAKARFNISNSTSDLRSAELSGDPPDLLRDGPMYHAMRPTPGLRKTSSEISINIANEDQGFIRPNISLSTWGERPKRQVSIKYDRDYVFGGMKSAQPTSLNGLAKPPTAPVKSAVSEKPSNAGTATSPGHKGPKTLAYKMLETGNTKPLKQILEREKNYNDIPETTNTRWLEHNIGIDSLSLPTVKPPVEVRSDFPKRVEKESRLQFTGDNSVQPAKEATSLDNLHVPIVRGVELKKPYRMESDNRMVKEPAVPPAEFLVVREFLKSRDDVQHQKEPQPRPVSSYLFGYEPKVKVPTPPAPPPPLPKKFNSVVDLSKVTLKPVNAAGSRQKLRQREVDPREELMASIRSFGKSNLQFCDIFGLNSLKSSQNMIKFCQKFTYTDAFHVICAPPLSTSVAAILHSLRRVGEKSHLRRESNPASHTRCSSHVYIDCMAHWLTATGMAAGPDIDEKLDKNRSSNVEPTGHGIKLGWIQGVLIPCLLNIWGVMLFLRLSWVVGESGILYTLVIITISYVVCVITTLSLSAISTNGEVKGGGIYYIISRSLGPEFGASVGLILAFANAVAASMNTIGFCDSLNDLLKEHGLKIIDGATNDVRVVGVIAILIMIVICAVGMEWESKAQNFLVVIILAAIFNFLVGAIMGPQDDLAKAKGFEGMSWKLFKGNWNARDDFTVNDFFTVFAIFFPSVTGIQAGANISGDLKDPASSIPKGTLLSLLISMISYISFVIFAGSAALRNASGNITQYNDGTFTDCQDCKYGLVNDYTIMQLMSGWALLIYFGCWAATLSTALTNLLSVPRLIQALGIDHIYPGLIFFSKGYGKAGEPYRGYVLTFLISSAFVIIAELNAIAPLISNFYLASYALINFCTFHAALIRPLGWRPTFKYYNIWLSLLGAVLCVIIMFLINWIMSLVTFVVFFILYIVVVYRNPDANWGSSTQAQTYKTALMTAQKLASSSEHVKNYQPQLLVLSGQPQDRPALVDLANLITKNNSLMLCAEICQARMFYKEKILKVQKGYNWLNLKKIKGFFNVIEGLGMEEAAVSLMQASGVGKLKPNVLLMGYKSDWQKCHHKELLAYFNIMYEAFANRLAVAILRVPDGLDCSPTVVNSSNETSDVRLKDQEVVINDLGNSFSDLSGARTLEPSVLAQSSLTIAGLTILLPYILSTRSTFSGCEMRIFALASKKHDLKTEEEKSLPMPRKNQVPPAVYMAWLETLTRDMPPFLLIRGNQAPVLTFYS
ncbi:unnamed protein product [Nesidiocoris tenuis]|uniref:Bumetanide-sensitive sodium-(Potassium)-chloride cotransporter n=1 Tax=Nesidiocoris tenuis TaxID=355587 RepID=A0A6H5HME4_9HEMI|nr:unnamed protein product [Nesidiocoris tenuis]